MKSLLVLITFSLLIACSGSKNKQSREHKPFAEVKTAPFSAVKFEEEKVFVQVESKWFQFLKMDTLDADWILKAFKDEFDDQYKKRFSEDLVEFLQEVGIKPHATSTFAFIVF